ncbi:MULTISPECIES: LrgB family protein [Thiomicrorhabdus]|uniref:LrgB family protein n=1 Tax=Thiomicrorhabdus heinhorstiae TaxID=2748010 RepID=A0ABS0BSB2_9GAMM|nr:MULTISPECIES: LrgB family protein [Thiomicrorhabdus]MBF6056757.1 LrgB family protein [Thiomicrorhabdus heinhorstiae]
MNTHSAFWVYLSASPLFGLTLTLVCYLLASRLYKAARYNPLANPVPLAIIAIICILWLLEIPYKDYFSGAQFIHFLLGPATVALAIPLYFQLNALKTIWLPLIISLVIGISFSGVSAYYIAQWMGASEVTQLSMIPKSVTAPIAMGISEGLGGLPSLTAVFVVITGVIGAVFGTWLLRKVGIRGDAVKGVAIGVTAHGLGTARAFQVNPQMGAFAGLSMALAASISAFILPWVLEWIR